MRLHERDINQDVRDLSTVLGDVIKTQASPAGFETVETLRTAAIAYRRGDAESRREVVDLVSTLPPDRLATVVRAFTGYFELINLAEERERVRHIRAGTEDDSLGDDIDTTVASLAASDLSADAVEALLQDVHVQPTYTAHPTEARRKTIKAKLREIAELLETLDERRLTEQERSRYTQQIEAQVASLWQTSQLRDRRPEPLDEARNVQWYLENTLFDVVPELYAELERAIDAEFDDELSVPPLVEFRSWAGSDRDGNPFVDPDITGEVLSRQRTIVLRLYRERLSDLSGVLSQEAERVAIGDAVAESLAADKAVLPDVAETAETRYPSEPYRQKVYMMREKLDRVDDVRAGGYTDAAAFSTDLEVLSRDLRANDAGSIADAYVETLLRQVETFGFTLASLDLRDHQENHTAAAAELFDSVGVEYADMDESERQTLLTDAILQSEPVVDLEQYDEDTYDFSETTERVLERFTRLPEWQREYGVDAIDTYCISMTEEPSHVLEVLFLADQAGAVSLPEHCGLDIVPLLETQHALSHSEEILVPLFENQAYAQALTSRDQVQEIMLGYSDSNKENGFLAANWALYDAQRRLATITEEHDVTLRLFHGRGGSISRGGGPMNEAIRALPTDTATGEIKFTEQGEAIAETYANPVVAERNLEQMLDAQIQARRDAVADGRTDPRAEWTAALEFMADHARETYRSLLNTDGFVDYFQQATPIGVIEDLNMGSRPASRSETTRIEDLRAIPWVFSWTQSRCIITGWYSVGAGIDAYLEDGGDIETIQEMYDEWPFFQTVLDNASLALARTDMEIAEAYADLAEERTRNRIFPQLRAEYHRTADLIRTITGREDLIERDWLRDNLSLRNPYVDPLHLAQVQLLAADDRGELEDRILRLTVKGIAAGMKNTG